MSDWRDKKPGLDRANAVMKPWSDPMPYPRVYAAVYKVNRWLLFPGNLPCPTCGKGTHHDRIEMADQVFYKDQYPASRIISADRAERAVETQTFFDICDDESLWVGHSGGKFQILTGDSALDGPESKTLRGAYVSYHLKRGDTDGTSDTDTE